MHESLDLVHVFKVMFTAMMTLLTNKPQQVLEYIGDDTFRLKLAGVKIKFIMDELGHNTSLSLLGWKKRKLTQKHPMIDAFL